MRSIKKEISSWQLEVASQGVEHIGCCVYGISKRGATIALTYVASCTLPLVPPMRLPVGTPNTQKEGHREAARQAGAGEVHGQAECQRSLARVHGCGESVIIAG